MIITFMPGSGESYFCECVENSILLKQFSYEKIFSEYQEKTEVPFARSSRVIEEKRVKNKVTNPLYPENYLADILEKDAEYEYVLVPADYVILYRLHSYKVPFIMVAPAVKSAEAESIFDSKVFNDVMRLELKPREKLIKVKEQIDNLIDLFYEKHPEYEWESDYELSFVSELEEKMESEYDVTIINPEGNIVANLCGDYSADLKTIISCLGEKLVNKGYRIQIEQA